MVRRRSEPGTQEKTRSAAAEREITIVVHPRDSDFIRHAADTANLSSNAVAAIHLREDPNMPRGDAKLLTSLGCIEAKLSAHLHAIQECLQKNAEVFLDDELLLGVSEASPRLPESDRP